LCKRRIIFCRSPSKSAQDINTITVQNLASDWSAKATGGKNLAPLGSNGKLSLTISAKPVGVGAACQRLILAGRTIWIADAHGDDGKRFVVRADETLTAFLELESG
jgi:hypothetical protein